MKITTKGRYGLRVVLEMACKQDDELMTVAELSKKTDISEKYLEQIIGKLAKAKILISQRGVNGGYKLSRSSKDIFVGQILRATEGNLKTVECMQEGNKCERFESCLTVNVWVGLNKVINDYLDSVSIFTLLNNKEKLKLTKN